jgi:hypothetical protein
LGLVDVIPLRCLVATAQQQNQRVAVLEVIDPVAGADVEAEFRHAVADRLDVAGVAVREPVDALQDP